MFLWGSRWVHAGDTRGNHAKGSDGDHRKERSGVGRHMGGVRFKKIMWSHVHVLSSLSLSLCLSLSPPCFVVVGPSISLPLLVFTTYISIHSWGWDDPTELLITLALYCASYYCPPSPSNHVFQNLRVYTYT